jgi:hypothetical protein
MLQIDPMNPSSRATTTKKNLTFPHMLTKTYLWFAVTLCSLALLFLPSTKLLLAQHQEVSPYNLENTNYTDKADPYGYLSLLSTTFLRNSLSQTFQTPAPLEQRGSIPREATPEALGSFVSHYGLQGKWLAGEDIERSLARDSSLKGCQMFQDYSSGGLILPVSQPEYHFIALLEAGSDYVYAFDPFVGRVIYSCETLLEVWEGKAFTAY